MSSSKADKSPKTPPHRNSIGSNDSSARKSIFSKLMKRKSSTASSSPRRSSLLRSQTPPKSSKPTLSRNHSTRSSIKPIVDDGEDIGDDIESGYNSDDTFNENEDSDSSSLYSNLLKTTSMSVTENNHTTYNSPEYVDDQLNLLLPSADASPWKGFNHEALDVPKYIKATRRNKGSPHLLKRLFLAQELNDESELDSDPDVSSASAPESLPEDILGKSSSKTEDALSREIFTMLFSRDGKYLAVAGRDAVIKVYKVISSPLGRMEYNNYEEAHYKHKKKKKSDPIYEYAPVFHQKPVRVFKGHKLSVLAIDWSKNNFLISGSMDKTVKLWHVDRPDALATFQHEDFVTTVKFHPNDDRFFLSGSLDDYARLWSILERSVAYGRSLGDETLITASTFTPDGAYCIFGGFNGSIVLLETKGLRVIRKIDIKPRSLLPLSNKLGNKITSIKVLPDSESPSETGYSKWTYLVTTNDSKIRLVNVKETKLVTRFKGATNTSSIEASTSDDGKYVLSGSEDHWCYIWENNNSLINSKLKTVVRDVMSEGRNHINELQHKHKKYYDLIYKNKLLKKFNVDLFLKGEDYDIISNENNSYTCFHAHHTPVNSAIFAPNLTKKLLEFSDDLIFDMIRRGRNFTGVEEFSKVRLPTEEQLDGDTPGFIIVTTDETGVIRVFRQDPAYEIRKAILEYCKKQFKDECKSGNPRRIHSKSLSPIGSHTNFKTKFQTKVRSDSIRPVSPTSTASFVSLAPRLNNAPKSGSRPPLKSVSNGIFDLYHGSFNVKSDLLRPLSPIQNFDLSFTGLITPEVEASTPFPSIESRPSRNSVPVIKTAIGNSPAEEVNFHTPVATVPTKNPLRTVPIKASK